jgi:hypothetical protein
MRLFLFGLFSFMLGNAIAAPISETTLKTGEVAWRPGGTHAGQNVGKTGLWVIAPEPK